MKKKRNEMMHILIVISCLLFCFTNSFAVEEQEAPVLPVPQLPYTVQQPDDNQNNDIPREVLEKVPQEAVPNVRPDIPVNVPAEPVTPEQIKSFFSKPQEENYIILNFDNADLKDVINTVGSITNENFILSPGLDARITIHSAKKIPVSEVMNVFESVLEANGMSAVRSGEFLKIVTGTAAKQKPIEVRTGSQEENIPNVDRLVTQIVPVQFVPASEISSILSPMLSQFGSIIPNPRNNLLIINEISSNIIRLLKVLQEIDVNAFKNTRMSFFKPKYSDVQTLANELTEVLNALNLTREGIAVVPIERINSLVVFSASPILLKTVEGWIKKLDEEVMTGQNIFVYPVQNVKAETIATVLRSLYETSDGGSKPAVSAQKTQPAAGSKTEPPKTVTRGTGQQQSSANSKIEIITFEPTNSLVILAPGGIFREIEKTIKKIDTYPREVLIEAVVAQVTISNSDEFGIQWSVLDTVTRNNKYAKGDVTELIQNTASSVVTEKPTLSAGSAGGLSYFFFNPNKFTALVRALASSGKVDILSSPRLLVRDQEEASIEVGSEIPTATSSTTSSTTSDLTSQSIQYKTVGIKLKIKPTINEERTVVLDLEQEVSSQGEDVKVGTEGTTYPSFNATKAKTSIVVPDRQGIVIGGIMQEEKKKNYSGIPLLSSIPILGHLFRYQTDSVTKKELVIIITPSVVTNKAEGETFTNEFLGKLKEVKKYLTEKEMIYSKPALIVSPPSKTEETNPSKTNEP
ncbi:MAG: type II secretion system secretin GspD [Nitrospirae bacterium]|nr:type II secretion system secretin GspD [Nitrospirota bacterium]